MIGCKVKGVRHILNEAGAFGIAIDGDDVRLGLLFFKGVPSDRDDKLPTLKWYNLLKEWADVRVDRRELALA